MAGSTSFHKTWRLRELFLFLSERTLTDPEHPPREPEIGAAVFGRGPDFDPSLDPLVRVQTSQLRKRLHQYFSTEGAAEPVIIEIPKGIYAPAFRERALATAPEPEPEEDLLVGDGRHRWLAAVCFALVAACALLGAQNLRLRRTLGHNAPVPPTVARLWSQVLGPTHALSIVPADGSLSVFLDTTHRMVSATQYQRKRYEQRPPADPLAPAPEDPPEVRFARQLMDRPLTTLVDTDLALRVGTMSRALGGTATLVSARDVTAEHFKSANVVLPGPRRSNPWIELVEDRMTFPIGNDTQANTGFFHNRAPAAGEPKEYRVTGPQTGYCRVALTPNLDANGWLLLLTGNDVAATRAGVELVTDEAALGELARALGVTADQPFPPFEAMLQVRYIADAPLTYERIAIRTHPAGAR